jgi:hypothetical protein
MPRQATATPEFSVTVIDKDVSSALDAQMMHEAQHESHVRAVALKVGYQLDTIDPDLIQRDIAANMRRSVEACLEVGRGLVVLKEICGHGNFAQRLDVLNIDIHVASRFINAGTKFSKLPTSATLKAIGNQSKLFEMLVLDDEQIAEFELTGQTGELKLDDVATMSVKELRAALREAKLDKATDEKMLSDRDTTIKKLQRRIDKTTPDQALLDLQKESTELMNDALGCLRGQMRQACIALRSHAERYDAGDQQVFMAGLVGQIQGELNTLRHEFNLPDVSTAVEQQLVAESQQWDK